MVLSGGCLFLIILSAMVTMKGLAVMAFFVGLSETSRSPLSKLRAHYWISDTTPHAFCYRRSQQSSSLASSPEDENEKNNNEPDNVDEIYASADSVFDIMDADANGVISYSELQSHLIDVCGYSQGAMDTMFYALDGNADGVITREELRMGFVRYETLRRAPGMMGQPESTLPFADELTRAKAAAMFMEIDVDGSGMIDNDELRTFLRNRGYGDNAIDNIYASLDVNADGQISQKELTEAFVRFSALRYATGAGDNDGSSSEFHL